MNSDMPFKKKDKIGQMMYNQSYLVSEIPIKISMIFHSDIVNPYSNYCHLCTNSVQNPTGM